MLCFWKGKNCQLLQPIIYDGIVVISLSFNKSQHIEIDAVVAIAPNLRGYDFSFGTFIVDVDELSESIFKWILWGSVAIFVEKIFSGKVQGILFGNCTKDQTDKLKSVGWVLAQFGILDSTV